MKDEICCANSIIIVSDIKLTVPRIIFSVSKLAVPIMRLVLTYLDVGPLVPLGAAGDEKHPSAMVTDHPVGSMTTDTHLCQVFLECTSSCLLWPPPLSSAVFWHPVHCCMCGSFSVHSENVASNFPSPCCNNVLESLVTWPRHEMPRIARRQQRWNTSNM